MCRYRYKHFDLSHTSTCGSVGRYFHTIQESTFGPAVRIQHPLPEEENYGRLVSSRIKQQLGTRRSHPLALSIRVGGEPEGEIARHSQGGDREKSEVGTS